MNIRRPALILAILFSVALVVGFVAPTTLAYLANNTQRYTNIFGAPYFTPEPTEVKVTVRKNMFTIGSANIGPEGFIFQLDKLDGDENFRLITDANGLASVILPFTDADAGKTYEYRLTEINDGRPNVIYSTEEYLIRISVEVNTDNKVVASVTMNGKPVQTVEATFTNAYQRVLPVFPDLPPTGDRSQPLLYMSLMLISAAGAFALMKRRKVN